MINEAFMGKSTARQTELWAFKLHTKSGKLGELKPDSTPASSKMSK
jgi:hypothetical protein